MRAVMPYARQQASERIQQSLAKAAYGRGLSTTWSGNLVRLGVTMTRGVLTACRLPMSSGSSLPEEISTLLRDCRSGSGPLGHGPKAYSVPHFDFHVLTFLTSEELGQISPGSGHRCRSRPRSGPPDYHAALDRTDCRHALGRHPGCRIPRQALHRNFVYGFHDGKMAVPGAYDCLRIPGH